MDVALQPEIQLLIQRAVSDAVTRSMQAQELNVNWTAIGVMLSGFGLICSFIWSIFATQFKRPLMELANAVKDICDKHARTVTILEVLSSNVSDYRVRFNKVELDVDNIGTRLIKVEEHVAHLNCMNKWRVPVVAERCITMEE